MRLLLEHPEQFIANNKNLGRACHSMLAIGGTVAATAISVGGTMLVNEMNKPKGGGPKYKAPAGSNGSGGVGFEEVSFNPVSNVKYYPTHGSADLLENYPNLAAFASQATAFQTQQRESIMPGSAKIMQQGSGVLQDWLQGKVGSDVVDFTNRAVAERTGGGFNPFTGGGQSQQAFARSIGKLSSDFQQMGVSAAPAWQQLANSFVFDLGKTAQLALEFGNSRYRYDALNSSIDQFNSMGELRADMFNSDGSMKAQAINLNQGNVVAENQYQSGMNTWMADQNAANQRKAEQMQMVGTAANAATGVAGAFSGYRSPSVANSASFAPAGSMISTSGAPSSVRSKYGW